MTIPFSAFADSDLSGSVGETAPCPKCGTIRPVEYGEEVMPDGTKKPSKLLAFVRCCEGSYLVGISGRMIK